MALPIKNRLKKKKDFENVFKNSSALKGDFLLIKVKSNLLGIMRVGFVIPSKVIKKAVDRNRFKRILSNQAYKYAKLKVKTGFDIIVILRKSKDEKKLIEEFDCIMNKLLSVYA